jgi:hypothetical protein
MERHAQKEQHDVRFHRVATDGGRTRWKLDCLDCDWTDEVVDESEPARGPPKPVRDLATGHKHTQPEEHIVQVSATPLDASEDIDPSLLTDGGRQSSNSDRDDGTWHLVCRDCTFEAVDATDGGRRRLLHGSRVHQTTWGHCVEVQRIDDGHGRDRPLTDGGHVRRTGYEETLRRVIVAVMIGTVAMAGLVVAGAIVLLAWGVQL